MTHEEILKRAANLGKRNSEKGIALSKNKEHMSHIGRLGGIASGVARRKKKINKTFNR